MPLHELAHPVDSRSFYDALAPEYRDISERRLAYLDAIDALVVQRAKKNNPQTYLDVGCGDGRRTLKIASALGVKSVLGVDESHNMLAHIHRIDGIELENKSILSLEKEAGSFDIITALWNVMGHLPDTESRVRAIGKITSFMSPGGSFFLDVNNRYNSKAYGEETVQSNIDADTKGKDSGKVEAIYTIDGKAISTIGYVFHPSEIDDLLAPHSGLSIREKVFVDYRTGRIVQSENEGQIFYEIVKA